MRYRQLDDLGDYTVGLPFYANVPAAVEQAISTRLKLWQGEWFVDTTDGTPYDAQVLGKRGGKNPDAAIKARILGTPGVTSIESYSSSFDGTTRTLTVNAQVMTQYSQQPITVNEVL